MELSEQGKRFHKKTEQCLKQLNESVQIGRELDYFRRPGGTLLNNENFVFKRLTSYSEFFCWRIRKVSFNYCKYVAAGQSI